MDEGGNGKAEEEVERVWYEDEVPNFVHGPFRESLEMEVGATPVRTCGGGGAVSRPRHGILIWTVCSPSECISMDRT